MSLLEQARGIAAGTTKGPACSVTVALRTHADLADEIRAVIRDRDISGGSAERAFQAHGVDITKITVERHRRNQCATCRSMGVNW